MHEYILFLSTIVAYNLLHYCFVELGLKQLKAPTVPTLDASD